MNLILLSGGSGKRLWPLSNDSRSKQFLKVLKNEHGIYESMVQRVWRQITSVELGSSTLIATSKPQVDILHSQLGDEIEIIVEPSRRDTFPAIALSASYLHSVKQVGEEEIIIVLPVDPFVEASFFTVFKQLETALKTSQADLALIGVVPTYPSEKYGYIIPDPTLTEKKYLTVQSFKEKPNQAQARQFIDQHALWNCGVFAFRLKYLLNHLSRHDYPTEYYELLQQYHDLPKISFDYEIAEKAEKVVALPYEGIWKDLGTWNTLTEEMNSPLLGKGWVGVDSNNTHVVNELDIPIAVLGVPNVIVAASPDGILVADKEASPKVKELVDFNSRPMYEERFWGWYKVVDYTKHEVEVLTRRISMYAGKHLSYHFHKLRKEVWTVVSGQGETVIEGMRRSVRAGDVIEIAAGTRHALRAITDLEMIEVQHGTELVESDVIRLLMDWETIMQQVLPDSLPKEASGGLL
ncbi:sugar phosphate nucleotidyltransferase [Paenibacillaceae bacterium WGS1546]|uniref:sugar phosphate nucleotidyltransferase n=1 Tax=Cohnella sp. WGS1546 TaxID=3366810 RepID=UPI00372CF6C3